METASILPSLFFNNFTPACKKGIKGATRCEIIRDKEKKTLIKKEDNKKTGIKKTKDNN